MRNDQKWEKAIMLFPIHAKGSDLPSRYSLKDYQDPSWNPPDKAAMVEYLRKSPKMVSSAPPSKCENCDENVSTSSIFYDGHWIWFGLLQHYVEQHAVRLPDSFVEHIRRRNHNVVPYSQVNWTKINW